MRLMSSIRTTRSSYAHSKTRRQTRCHVPKDAAQLPSMILGHRALDYRSKLLLYNTMSRSKQSFVTRTDKPDTVQMYVCGVTVYDFSHIGHARVYVAFDILYRLLSQVLGYHVQYVRNFTDIDDKIIRRANEKGEDPLALSRRFIDEFHRDMEQLNCLPPSFEPKATDFIPEMISTIETIIKNGHAYAVEGDVFFEVNSLPGYGCLSGRSQEDNRAGERVDVDPRKRGPADFALWKSVKAGELSWPSPWGPGRPGWHIECSSMIEKVMGRVIDIHGGGRDLVFPHHENELAQSRAAAGPASCGCRSEPDSHKGTAEPSSRGEQFVRYWLHIGFVNVDSEKMSKSLGNFFTIRDVIQKYHPLALRWFLVNTQYRQQVNYTQRALDEASNRIYYTYQSLIDISNALDSAGQDGLLARSEAASMPCLISHAAILALLDDLNTPSAVSEISAPLKQANDLLTTKAGKKQVGRLVSLAKIEMGVRSVLSILGLFSSLSKSLGDSSTEVLLRLINDMKELALVRSGIDEAFVASSIKERAEARLAKDFQRADEVRVKLSSLGVILKDSPEGTTWMPAAGQPPSQ